MESEHGAKAMSTVDAAYTPCINMCILYWVVWRSQEKKVLDEGLLNGGSSC
jgi:hypothetical protein